MGFAALSATAAYEAIKQRSFGNLTPWESHTITIVYCATLVFILSALFLRREEAKVRESKALNESLMESLPGVVCVFDSSGKIRRSNTKFLSYSAATGEITNFVAIKQDVTERKRVDAALRQSQEQFRQLAENIPEVFFAMSLDPISITYVSPAYDAVWGRSRRTLEDDPGAWIEAVHPEDRERIGTPYTASRGYLCRKATRRHAFPGSD